MEAVARYQALDIKENGNVADEMDVTYITERIIVLLFHSTGKDAAYKASFSEASSQLRAKHKDHCLMVNLSERRSDMHKWHKNVLDFGWPDLLAPPLERLCNICKSMDSWLSTDPSNVVVIHCKAGLGRVGVVIAAYIDYGKICASSDQASDQMALKRFYQQKLSNTPEPSQLRYVHYFVGLLSGAVKINNQPLYLHQIIVSGVPETGGSGVPEHGALTCSLYFKIYQNMQPVYISQVYSASKGKSSHINVALSPSLQLRGDVIVKCFQQQQGNSSSKQSGDTSKSDPSLIFFCQFHTCAVTNNSLRFSRSDLDLACHNNSAQFPKDGLVEFNFTAEEGTQEQTGYDLVGKSNVTSKNLLNVDELVRANSYENFNQFSSRESLLDGDTLRGKSKMYGMDGPVDGSIYRSANSRKESHISRENHGSMEHHQQASLSSTGVRSKTEVGMYNGLDERYEGKYFPPLNDTRKLDSSFNYNDSMTLATNDQSQLDDILNELMTEQLNLSLDGQESRLADHYPDTRQIDRTLSSLPPQKGTITTEADNSRSVLSWATSQSGPKHSVMVSKQTLTQPTPQHRIRTESSRYYESSHGRSHSSLGHSLMGPGQGLLDMPSPGAEDDMYLGGRRGREASSRRAVAEERYGGDDIDWNELMRKSTSEQNRREERRSETWRSSTQGSNPPTPPIRRRILSPDYTRAPNGSGDPPLLYSTPNRYRNYASDSEEPMSWLDKQRTKLRSKRSSTKPWLKHTPDEQALVSELELVQTRRRAMSDTEDLNPEPLRYKQSSRQVETRTEYYTSGGARGDHTRYKFSTSPSYSTSALNKPYSNSNTPESTLRSATNTRQSYEISSTNQRTSNSLQQKLQPPSLVEVEQEVISLQPIGPGVQNLEPGTEARTLSRSTTPAFSMSATANFPGSPPYDNKGYQIQQQHQTSRMSNSVSVPSSLAQDSQYGYRIESARTLGPRQSVPQSYTTLNTPQRVHQGYNTTEEIITRTQSEGVRRAMPRSQSAMGGEIKYGTQFISPQQSMIRGGQGYSSTTLLTGQPFPQTTETLEAIRVRQQQLLQQKQLLDEQERQLMIEQQRLQQQQQQQGRREVQTVTTETRTVRGQQQHQQQDGFTRQQDGFIRQQDGLSQDGFSVQQAQRQNDSFTRQHGDFNAQQQRQQGGFNRDGFSVQQAQRQQDSFVRQQDGGSSQRVSQQHGYSHSNIDQRSAVDIERDLELIMSDKRGGEPRRSGSPVYSSVRPANQRSQQSSGGILDESEIVVESANKQAMSSNTGSAFNRQAQSSNTAFHRQVQGSTTGRGYERQVEEEIIKPVSASMCGVSNTGVPPLSVVLGEESSSSMRAQSGSMHGRGYESRTNVSGSIAYGNTISGNSGYGNTVNESTIIGSPGYMNDSLAGNRSVINDQLSIETQNQSMDASRSQFYTSTMRGGAPSGHQQLSPNFYRSYSRTGSMASGIDGFDTINRTPRFVQDTSKYWHKPDITRDEAIALLRDKPAGSFVVRNSSTFQGAFGLAVKVDQLPPNVQARSQGDIQAELVRHFLIEPTSKGVRLKGCSNEPTFGSLAALVYQHTITPLALPCKLVLPQSDELSEVSASFSYATGSSPASQGAACNVLYLNSVDTESLTGPEAISRAIETTFKPKNSSPRTSVVHFKVSHEGVTLTDVKRRLFFRRHYPIESVTYCGVDTRDRRFEIKMDDGSTVTTGRLFGFVAHKPSSTLGIVDNSCHLFSELDPTQPASAIASFVTQLMTSGGGGSVTNSRHESFSSSRVATSGTAPRGILRSQ